MATGIIIQARATSKRFPGKVLANLAGKPVLKWVIEGCRLIPSDKIIVACPDDPRSDPIWGLCDNEGIEYFAGPEDDVLTRYWQAAKRHSLDRIVRVTSDCPLIDPTICQKVMELQSRKHADYASNVFPVRTFPKGFDCEVFTRDCLEEANNKAVDDYDREHVCTWMQRSPTILKANLTQESDMSDVNLCVDYPEDIKRLERAIAHYKAYEYGDGFEGETLQ